MAVQYSHVKFTDNSRKLGALYEAAYINGLNKVGEAWVKNAQRIVTEKDIYDTGNLHDSLTYETQESRKRIRFGSPVKYSSYQDLGTRFIKARPFMKPATLEYADEYKRVFANSFGSLK